MIEQISQLFGPAAPTVTKVLLHSLWQGSLVALLLAAAMVLLKRSSARLRYAVACMAMLLVVGLSVASGVYVAGENRSAAAGTAAEYHALNTSGPADSEATSAAASMTGTPESSATSGGWNLRPLQQLVFPSWIAGVLLLSLCHFIGWGKTRRLTRQGPAQVSEDWRARFRRLCNTAGLDRAIDIAGSSVARIPCVVGWAKPVILIPLSSFTGLEAEELEMIILHELAHIRRHDVLVGYFQTVVEILFFFNPAVWWISRQIRAEREHCCDDFAIALSGDRLGYARALTNLELTRTIRTRSARTSLVAAADSTPLLQRVRRILGAPSEQGQPSRGSVGGILLLATLLTVGFSALSGSTYSDTSSKTVLETSDKIESEDGDIYGEWEIESRGRRTQISMRFDREGTTGFSVNTDDLIGQNDLSGNRFKLERDAGTFYFEGQLERDGDELWGSGDCFFRANAEYVKAMEDLGYDLGTPGRSKYDQARSEYKRSRSRGSHNRDRSLILGIHDVTLAFARGLDSLGYDNLSFSKLLEAHIHNVSPEFIRELRELGYENLRMSKLVEMQIHDAEPDYIRELNRLGYTDLSPDRLVEMRIHDVEPEFIEELAELGYERLRPSELVEMQIHDVEPEFVRELDRLGYKDLSRSRLVEFQIHNVEPSFIEELAELGYDDLSPSKLVEFRIHSVTPRFVRELAELGYDDLSPSKLVEFKIHSVTPRFVRELAELGYDDLSPSKLVEFRIHSVTPRLIRELAELGYRDISPSRLVEMKIHNVTPSFIERLQSRGYDDLSPRELVDIKIHGR